MPKIGDADLDAETTPVPWTRRWWWRIIVVLVVQVVVLLLLAATMSTVSIGSVVAAAVAVIVIGAVDSLIWPVAIRFVLPLLVFTVGLLTFVLNGVLIWLASALVGDFEVSTVWAGIVCSIALAASSGIVGSLLSLDDDGSWQRIMVRRAIRDGDRVPPTNIPGALFIQIDGLSHDVLVEAMDAGFLPTLRTLIKGGHQLVPWECDLSSQTGAMQAGILHGNNENMPAFRWYDKELKRVLVSNSPQDAATIEQRQSGGDGLLAGGGASRGNVFSGDAADALYTFSQLKVGNGPAQRLIPLFASPHSFVRLVGLFLADVWREKRSARAAERDGFELHGHRGGVYPLLRASVTVGLAEITTATLAGDIYRGVPAAYCDMVGYDEVAHHSGVRRPESFDELRRIDDRIRRLMLGFEDAPRPYELVVLSDHGQTEGHTFLQRYGVSLNDVIQQLAGGRSVIAPPVVTEGWGNVNGLLTDVISDDSSFASRTIKRLLRKHVRDGEVEVGPAAHVHLDEVDDEIIVLASGNLGLVSFAGIEGRATLEDIAIAYPGLLTGLSEHEGIGFVMVRSADGAVVFGPRGVHHLGSGEIEGEDPLAPFGPNAARHLRRTDGFTNCPDLIVNSFYDAATEHGAAFEELVGFHGGLGGLQAEPFVLAPASMQLPTERIIGAESVHDVFQAWLRSLREQPASA